MHRHHGKCKYLPKNLTNQPAQTNKRFLTDEHPNRILLKNGRDFNGSFSGIEKDMIQFCFLRT
ncbi:MAG TPA: hypothetical protein DEB17_01780 [Chlorobaculum sp.]|uniref:Uncharacterized protein n=1 Tax=Chlorobaculum tepidum (strain ATCC 49652 / DSM 12025 / NBRC 103806 / TLS) TaxID=194439 RepID=Q8KDG7_CHLTE|nr:hypothetical protein CT1083 [Chlorobaculum tepidum TLS]HBU22729.1 hypothetical protein [Chlorobaculum sp.]